MPDEGRHLLDGLWVALPAPVPLLQADHARHAFVVGVSVAQLQVALPVGIPCVAEVKYCVSSFEAFSTGWPINSCTTFFDIKLKVVV